MSHLSMNLTRHYHSQFAYPWHIYVSLMPLPEAVTEDAPEQAGVPPRKDFMHQNRTLLAGVVCAPYSRNDSFPSLFSSVITGKVHDAKLPHAYKDYPDALLAQNRESELKPSNTMRGLFSAYSGKDQDALPAFRREFLDHYPALLQEVHGLHIRPLLAFNTAFEQVIGSKLHLYFHHVVNGTSKLQRRKEHEGTRAGLYDWLTSRESLNSTMLSLMLDVMDAHSKGDVPRHAEAHRKLNLMARKHVQMTLNFVPYLEDIGHAAGMGTYKVFDQNSWEDLSELALQVPELARTL